MRNLAGLVLLTLCATAPPPAAGEDPGRIPSPRPAGWVTDLTGRLDAGTVGKLNAMGDEVAGRRAGEIAFVVIETTDGRDHREFATRLFNRWGIGDRGRDDGVLILVALGDRAAEIVLGDGLDDERRVAASREVMDRVMVPLFRRGEPEQALLQGARRCAGDILGVDLAGTPTEIRAIAPPAPLPAAAPPRGGNWASPTLMLLGAGAGLIGAGGSWAGVRRYLRNRRRSCPACRLPMVRLGEAEDDGHLTPVELTEERLRSVDYDVWACGACAEVVKVRYGAFFTSYSDCPQCHARTKGRRAQTLRHATRYSTGIEQITERCEHCSYEETYRRTTPCLPPPSRSGTGSSSGTGSGFGGGSSAGAGASGRW